MTMKRPRRWDGQSDEQFAYALAMWRHAVARQRKISTAFELYRSCGRARCARMRACANADPSVCWWAFREAFSADEWLAERDTILAFADAHVGPPEPFVITDADRAEAAATGVAKRASGAGERRASQDA